MAPPQTGQRDFCIGTGAELSTESRRSRRHASGFVPQRKSRRGTEGALRLPQRTRCDSESLDSDVITMTAKGQRLGRGCRPLLLVVAGLSIPRVAGEVPSTQKQARPVGRTSAGVLGCQLGPGSSSVVGTLCAVGRSLPRMSLAFALMAAINGSTGSSATLSHGLFRTKPPRGQSDGRARKPSRTLSGKPNLTRAVFADLVRAAQAARHGPPRPKWFTPES